MVSTQKDNRVQFNGVQCEIAERNKTVKGIVLGCESHTASE